MAIASRRLLVVKNSDLARWDFKSARASAYRLAHPTYRPLGDFIVEATELVRPSEEPDKSWPVYGVNNVTGVFLSDWQKGSEFNAPYKAIRKDWFFHNPTRANVGSLGRVPEVPPDAITSPEYQVWRIRDGLLPEYVEILIRTRLFTELIDCHRVGGVKERLFVQNLMEIPVPVLSLEAQRTVVDRRQRSSVDIDRVEREIETARTDISERFYADLGLRRQAPRTLPRAMAVSWPETPSWSVRSTRFLLQQPGFSGCRYSIVSGREFLSEVKHGSSASPASEPTDLMVLKISAVTKGHLDPSEYKFAVDLQRSREEFDLRGGDVLMCRTNGSLNLVGMSALVEQPLKDTIFPDKVIRVRALDNILPQYLWHVLKAQQVRAQIESAARTAVGNYAIGSEDIWNLQVPLPPIPEQQDIMDRVMAGQLRIAALQDELLQRRTELTDELETMILHAAA